MKARPESPCARPALECLDVSVSYSSSFSATFSLRLAVRPHISALRPHTGGKTRLLASGIDGWAGEERCAALPFPLSPHSPSPPPLLLCGFSAFCRHGLVVCFPYSCFRPARHVHAVVDTANGSPLLLPLFPCAHPPVFSFLATDPVVDHRPPYAASSSFKSSSRVGGAFSLFPNREGSIIRVFPMLVVVDAGHGLRVGAAQFEENGGQDERPPTRKGTLRSMQRHGRGQRALLIRLQLARTRGATSCEDSCVVGRSVVCPGGVSCALPSAVRGVWCLDRRIMDTRVRCGCRGWAWAMGRWAIGLDVSETAPPPAVYDERGLRLTLRLEICTYPLRGWRHLSKIASLRCYARRGRMGCG